MSKRALMLTAATAALLSSHAAAQTQITTKVTSPQSTSADGTITITTTGSIVITANPPTAPAITINGGKTPGTAADVINQGKIIYSGVGSSSNPLTGIEMVTGNTGGLDNVGTIDFTGAGTNKTGILVSGTSAFIGDITQTQGGTALDTISGITSFNAANPAAVLLETASTVKIQGDSSIGINIPTGATLGSASQLSDIDILGALTMTPTSSSSAASASYGIQVAGTMYGNINLVSGGELQLQGNGNSYGIYLPAATNGGNPGTLNGNINIGGNLTVTPVSTTSTTSTGDAGVYVAGVLNGNINVGTSGQISAGGAGAQGVVITGTVNGDIENQNQIQTFGISNPVTRSGNPQAGSALDIGGSVTGGIYNAGPNGQGSTTASATLGSTGDAATLLILPSSTQTAPITIGGFSDQGDTGSILNRGSILNASENIDGSSVAVDISGPSSAVSVDLASGIFNSGVISATASTDAKGSISTSATALLIGQNVTVSGSGTLPSLVNSNEDPARPGSITASVSGDQGGQARAIQIESGNTFLTGILNEGTISAFATTTNTALKGGAVQAYAIIDSSGSLTSITNNPGAMIEASATPLQDLSQVAVAIDTEATTGTGLTLNNMGTINGDLRLGGTADSVTVQGSSSLTPATITGNIYFGGTSGGGHDQLDITGDAATVKGQIYSGTVSNPTAGFVDISIAQGGTLDLLTSATSQNPLYTGPLLQGTTLNAGTFSVDNQSFLDLHYSQAFNRDLFPGAVIINAANSASILDGATVTLTPDSFIAPPVGDKSASFVLLQSPSLAVSGAELAAIQNRFVSNLSYLYSPVASGVSVSGNDLLLTITPKAIGLDGCKTQLEINGCNLNDIPLGGYAARVFPYANVALGNDNALGSAVIQGVTNSVNAQETYSNFAPDVSGSTRATAISLTDDATNVVAARQRVLREYANQDGDLTLWGQQFVQRLAQSPTADGPGYTDTGFGFAAGLDEGDPADGRYGAAFTFFTGDARGQAPRLNKTSSEWYLLTGYTDWRGSHLFLDTQGSLGYTSLTGNRYLQLDISNPGGGQTVLTRTAMSNHPGEFLSGSAATGAIFDEGGTVFTPEISLDGLAMREESYSEAGGGNGFDLHVASSYAQSLRAFTGVDVRQDFDFTDFLLQPEVRAGYRYDFANGAQSVKANFESVTPASVFELTGPKPDKGNLVAGGGLAVSTGAWSLGLNFDYLKAGSGNTSEEATISLLGRI